jgi:catechol 2,3-dioxygenase-like lactoylglutathione lyase family enzyme
MKIQWMNHTGFVVKDMDRSLAFYRDLLGLRVERDGILEGDFISELVGYPDARLHIVYLGVGDLRHDVELIQYLNPTDGDVTVTDRNSIGASHLGVIVDDLDAWYEKLTAKGVRFVNPPAIRPKAVYPLASKGCYLQDPDGNWLEFLERPPVETSMVEA